MPFIDIQYTSLLDVYWTSEVDQMLVARDNT